VHRGRENMPFSPLKMVCVIEKKESENIDEAETVTNTRKTI